MPRLPLLLVLPCLLLLLLGASAPQDDAAAPPATEAPPAGEEPAAPSRPRVVLRLDQTRSVAGHLRLATPDVVVIETLDGEVASYPASRVLKVVRLTDPGPEGRPGVVLMMNGARRQGHVLRDDWDLVVLEIEGVRLEFARAIVDEVVLAPTVDELYAARKAMIDPEERDLHLALCEWLARERRWEDAERELLELLRRHDDPRARTQLRIVRAQLAIRSPDDAGSGRSDAPPDAPGEATRPRWIPPLDDEAVNLIRVYEIDFRDPPRLVVTRDTIGRLLDRYGSHQLMPTAEAERLGLYRARAIDVARFMFDLRARDLYGEIRVLTEPTALGLFRERVHDAWLIQNCSTSRCHGGPAGGRFRLFTERFRDPRVRAANLLTLVRWEPIDGLPLVDWEDPARSLLLEYGLPAHLARHPHPPVANWTPAFHGPDDRTYGFGVRWIESMLRPRPEYPVAFDPLRDGPAAGERGPSAEDGQPDR